MSAALETEHGAAGGFRRFSDGRAVGDVIPFFWEGVYHLYVLAPPAGAMHYPSRLLTTWRHIASEDLVNWHELEPAISPGRQGEPDDGGVWTGSVVDAGGLLHAFYTGHAASGAQTICHATSTDGTRWLKDPDNPISCPDLERFEANDWRDPFVLWNPADGKYWMLLTARALVGGSPRRGVIARMTSSDLLTWSSPSVFYETFLAHAPECPELFELDGRWVLAYSRFTDRAGTVYRVADSIDGPWRVLGSGAPDAALWYAAKGLTDATGRRLSFGWIPERDAAPPVPAHPWLWAGDLALTRQLSLSAQGHIRMTAATEMSRLVSDLVPNAPTSIIGAWATDANGFKVATVGNLAVMVFEAEEEVDSACFTATFDTTSVVHQVGVAVSTNNEVGVGVAVLYYPQTGRIAMIELSSSSGPDPSVFGSGAYAPVAEQVLSTSPVGEVSLRIIVRQDLVEAFIGGVNCLTYRTTSSPSRHVALLVHDGDCEVRDVSWRRFRA